MKKRLLFLVVLTVFCGIILDAEAKRMPPEPVSPLEYEGIEFRVPDSGRRFDEEINTASYYIEVYDVQTGEMLFEKKAYEIEEDPSLEADVQHVFIKNLEVEGNNLVVINEKGERFEFDIEALLEEGLEEQQ